MGILDDLAMGFGLKERTEDYDARTARTLALNEQYGNEEDRLRARASGAYNIGTGRAAQYLGSRGYDEGYTPQVADDERPFMQRLLTSPEDTASPTPYAIGPLSMDQPLPQFGLLGLFTKGLSGLFQGGDDTDASINVGKRAMGMLPADGDVSPVTGGNGQRETRFDTRTEAEPIDFSDAIPVTDPALIPAIEALALEEGTIPLDPSLPPSSLNAVDPLRLSDMGVDEYGRRVPNKLPKDPKYITGIDMEFPALSAPPLSEASATSIPLGQLPQGLAGVQLGAYDTISDANAAYQSLINQNPQLSSYQPILENAEYNGRNYYRVRLKGFDDLSQAKKFSRGLTGVDAYPVYGKRVK